MKLSLKTIIFSSSLKTIIYLKDTENHNFLSSLKTTNCLKDRDCFNKMRILGEKSRTGLEPKKKKNEEIVKITFTADRDLDDYLRSKNLLEEKKKKKQELPKGEEEKNEEDKNISALLSWNPNQPNVDTTITESSDSECNVLECHGEIEMAQEECQHTGDEICFEYNSDNNNEMTEVEIEAAYDDLCAEISQEYVDDKGKGSFWPNSLQNKFSRVESIDGEFSKREREEERTTRLEDEGEEFTRMEEQEDEDEEWPPSEPTEEWIGVVVEEVIVFLNQVSKILLSKSNISFKLSNLC